MKILHTADWHLGVKVPQIGIERTQEQSKVIDRIRKVIYEEKIDIVIISGDIFDNPVPSIEAEKVFFEFLSDVAGDMGKYILLINGNHDSVEKIAMFNILSKRFNNRLKSFSIKDSLSNSELSLDLEGITFIGIPFIPKYRYSGEYSVIFEKILGDYLSEKSGDNVILFSHDTLKGATYSRTEVEFDDKTLDPESVMKMSGFKKVIYWGLGHIHKYQKINEKMYYSGSIIQIDFGERGQKKGVIIVSIENSYILPKVEFREIQQEVELIQKEIIKEENVQEILDQKDIYNSNFVKLVIKKEISHSLIREIKEKIKNVIITNESTTYNKDNTNISKYKEVILDPIEMFKKYWKEEKKQKLSDKEIEKLKEIYQEILNANNQYLS